MAAKPIYGFWYQLGCHNPGKTLVMLDIVKSLWPLSVTSSMSRSHMNVEILKVICSSWMSRSNFGNFMWVVWIECQGHIYVEILWVVCLSWMSRLHLCGNSVFGNVKVTHEWRNSVGDLFEFNVKVTQHECLKFHELIVWLVPKVMW